VATPPTAPDSAKPPKSSTQETSTGLVRALGPVIATAVVVGNVIGSGIFLKPGNIASASGDFTLIISVWIFGGLLCVLGGLCFAELAAMYPRVGGMYAYLREAYGRWVAFLFGWTEVFFSKPASIGALSVAFVGSFSLAMGNSLSATTQVVLAGCLIAAMAWVNILGVLWGGRLQLGITIIKAVFLAMVAFLPFVMMPFVSDVIDISNYSTHVKPTHTGLAAQVGVVLLAVMWAYNGWHGITPLAEEVKQPHRNIPLALFVGIGILIVLYVAANFAYHGVLTMTEMKSAGDHAAEEMLKKLFGQRGLAAMSAVIMCSTFGAINTNLLQAPRITFAMGHDRAFFPALGNVHATYRTPAVAITVMATMSILLVSAIAIAKNIVEEKGPEKSVSVVLVADEDEAAEKDASEDKESNGEPGDGEYGAKDESQELGPMLLASLRNDTIFSLLTNFVIFSASIFYMLAVLAVIVLRFRQPDLERPYRTWGYPVVPILFLVVYFWFMLQIYKSNPLESRTGLIFIGLGIPVYLGFQFSQRRKDSADM
jgi:basic amino acid/polyamine antiporter, APA family